MDGRAAPGPGAVLLQRRAGPAAPCPVQGEAGGFRESGSGPPGRLPWRPVGAHAPWPSPSWALPRPRPPGPASTLWARSPSLHCAGPSSGLGWRCQQLPALPPQSCLPLASPTGRYPEVNAEALRDLEKVAAARGLNSESIFIPKQRGRRAPAGLSQPPGRAPGTKTWCRTSCRDSWLCPPGGGNRGRGRAWGPEGIEALLSPVSFFHRSLLSRGPLG